MKVDTFNKVSFSKEFEKCATILGVAGIERNISLTYVIDDMYSYVTTMTVLQTIKNSLDNINYSPKDTIITAMLDLLYTELFLMIEAVNDIAKDKRYYSKWLMQK